MDAFPYTQDSRFNPEVDMISGFRTHSALCIPILGDIEDDDGVDGNSGVGGASGVGQRARERGVVGVLQLLNKFRPDGEGEADWDVEPKVTSFY